MRTDPIEFVPATAPRTKRVPSGFSKSLRAARSTSSEQPAAVVDEAFAEYAHAVTRDLVADIAVQLKTLDRQREQLSRLLQTVDLGTTTG